MTGSVAARSRRWPLSRILLVAFAVCFGNAVLWSCMTPLGAAPDEPAHIVKAGGVVRGQWFGEDVDGTQTRSFVVPSGFGQVKFLTLCNMGQPDKPSGCAELDESTADDLITETSTAGLYNPTYYLLVGWPSLFDGGGTAIGAMRLISAAIVSVFGALAIGMLSLLPRGRLAVAATAIAFTPMLWFLAGAVNPNALEVTGTAAFFGALLVMLRVRPRGRLGAAVLATLVASGIIVTQVRTLGFVWLGVAVIVAFLMVGVVPSLMRIIRGPLLGATIAVVVAAIAAIAIALSTGTLNQNGVYPGAGTPFSLGFRTMIDRTFYYLDQAIGLFGWADAPAPGLTTTVYAAVGLALIAVPVVLAPRSRATAGVLSALAAFVLLPALIQAASVVTSGYIWQGRYNLALVAVLVMASSVAAGEAMSGRIDLPSARRLRLLIIATGAICTATAAITLLRRETLGYDEDTVRLWGETPWQPLGIPTAGWMILIILVAIGTVAGLRGIAERGARSPRARAASPNL